MVNELFFGVIPKKEMPVFLLKFKMLDVCRADCMTLFGGMSVEDDEKEMGPHVKIVGRWCTLGEGAGFCVCRSTNAKALGDWLLRWVPMATIQVVPVVDDNQARQIILRREPEYVVDYSRAGNSPASDDESLYVIEYAFKEGCKEEGFHTFAELSQEADGADAGENTLLGRWHDLGTGTGIAVCSSKSELALHKWAHNWTKLCDCKITPVLIDSQFRELIQSQPGFADEKAALMKKMQPPAPPRRSFFS